MSFTVTPNCSILVTNINNEYGSPHEYWTFYYCFSTSWTSYLSDTVLLMVLMQWMNRWYKLPVTRGWRKHCRLFAYMWTQNCVQIFSLNCKLFLELLSLLIWRILSSFCTSLPAHCWKFLPSHRDLRECFFYGCECIFSSTLCWQASLWSAVGDWAQAGLGCMARKPRDGLKAVMCSI